MGYLKFYTIFSYLNGGVMTSRDKNKLYKMNQTMKVPLFYSLQLPDSK